MSLVIGAKWRGAMRLAAGLAVLASASAPVMADAVPDGIKAWFASMQTKAMVLEGGVLRVAMAKPVVTAELFDTQIKGLCQAPLVGQRYDWGTARIERIEILNDAGQQGFALLGGRAGCRKLNGMNSDEAAGFLARERREVKAGRVQG